MILGLVALSYIFRYVVVYYLIHGISASNI